MMGKLTKREFFRLSAAGAACLACQGLSKASSAAKDPGKFILPVAEPAKDPGKFSTEARFYTVTPRGVQCGICPNECTLKSGEESTCHNRVNHGNKLWSVAYGNPCAVHVDPVEKKPLLHFLPQSATFSIATAGCSFACLNCQNWEISQTSPGKTRNVTLMPAEVVKRCVENHCSSIAYTYSEPVSFYEYMSDTAKIASGKGIRNIMVSNGYINPEPLKQLIPYLDAANIDLKAFDPSVYLKLTGGKMQPVLDALVDFQKSKVWLEITNLVVPSWSDNLDMISRMCKWLAQNGFSEVPLHFSRFTPLYKLTQLPPTPLNTLIKAREAAVAEGLKYVYIGNVPGKGFENTSCPSCGKMVIERRGFSILANHLENGRCRFCQATIAGVWS